MTRSTSRDSISARQAAVLTRALLRSAISLGLGRRQLAKAIGVSETTIGRFARGERHLEPGSEQWELAVMLVGAYQALFTLVGGNENKMRDWMSGYNRVLTPRPRNPFSLLRVLSALSYLREMTSLL